MAKCTGSTTRTMPGGVMGILLGDVDYDSYNGTGDTSYVDYYLTAHDGTVGGG